MGDCVEVLLDGSGKEEATTGYAEILWLWRSAAVAVQEEVYGGRGGGREGESAVSVRGNLMYICNYRECPSAEAKLGT